MNDKIGNKIIHFETIGSTNDELKNMALNSNASHGLLLTSGEQTKGRGRVYNRKWNSSTGNGVYMSALLKPETLPLEQIPSLTLMVAVAVREAISEFADVDCKIKWPNDILLNNKKLSGILVETNFVSTECKYVIVGIGVNVLTEKFDEELQKIATSLFLETGRLFSIKNLIVHIVEKLNLFYDIFIQDGFSSLKNEYKKHCINLNKNVNFVLNHDKEIIDEVVAINISDLGDLVVKNNNGKIYTVNSGEVSLKI